MFFVACLSRDVRSNVCHNLCHLAKTCRLLLLLYRSCRRICCWSCSFSFCYVVNILHVFFRSLHHMGHLRLLQVLAAVPWTLIGFVFLIGACLSLFWLSKVSLLLPHLQDKHHWSLHLRMLKTSLLKRGGIGVLHEFSSWTCVLIFLLCLVEADKACWCLRQVWPSVTWMDIAWILIGCILVHACSWFLHT